MGSERRRRPVLGHRPIPFERHAVRLIAGFRTSIPQVAAILPHLPDAEIAHIHRELALLRTTLDEEMYKRGTDH